MLFGNLKQNKRLKNILSINLASVCQLSNECALVLNRALKECSAYWNAIKSARHFLKTPCCDLILPHFTILCCGFCPIMLPSKTKAGWGGRLVSKWSIILLTPTTTYIQVWRRLLLHHSNTNHPRKHVLCLHSTNCNITTEGGRLGAQLRNTKQSVQ